MLYEELHEFLLRKASSKEIDILLELIRNKNWNNVVRVDVYGVALKAKTTVRYVREVLNRLTIQYKGKRVLNKIDNDTYEFLRGKTTILHSKSDKYCKLYKYLYGETFKELTLYGKRLLLTTAMNTSQTGMGVVYIPINDLVYRDEISSGLIPNKTILDKEITKINELYDGSIKLALTSVVTKRSEYVYVEIQKDLLEDVVHNYSEREYLRDTLFDSGYVGYLKDEYCIEIEKVGKHIFNYLVRDNLDKNGEYNGDFVKDMLDVAREIYTTSIKRLSKHLHKMILNGEESKAVSAYFSSVVFSVLMEYVALNKNKKINIEKVLEYVDVSAKELEYNKRVKNIQILIKIIDKWCFKWIRTRFKKDERNWEKNKKNIKRNNKLKEYVQTSIKEIEHKVKVNGSKEVKEWLIEYKDEISDFIDINNTKMETIF